MAVSRYARAPVMELGKRYGTSRAVDAIRRAIDAKTLSYTERTLKGAARTDTIAFEEYGDGRYWWIIAAASNIGWAPQVPPGTYLRVPDLAATLAIVG